MPVDVRNVDGEDEEGRVPTGTSVLVPVLRLNEDIRVTSNDRGLPAPVDHPGQPEMAWRNTFTRHARQSTVTALKVRNRRGCRVFRPQAKNLQLANFAFALHFFAEYVAALEYVSRNAFHHASPRLSVTTPSLQGHRCSQQSLLKARSF